MAARRRSDVFDNQVRGALQPREAEDYALMAKFYDGHDSDYQDPTSAFDCTKMKTLFNWTPSHSWRDG